jgi:hypothetical protein
MYDLMSQFRTVDLGKIDRVIKETNTSNQGKVWSWFHGVTRDKGKCLSNRGWIAGYRFMCETQWAVRVKRLVHLRQYLESGRLYKLSKIFRKI